MSEIDDHAWRDRLREVVKARGVKITEVSAMIGKDRDYLSRVINKGTGNPSPGLFAEICRIIGVTPSYILFGQSESEMNDTTVKAALSVDQQTADRLLDIAQKLQAGKLDTPKD